MTIKVPLKLRLVKKPTQWLRELPAGHYSVDEIKKATGKCSSCIKGRLNLLEIPRRYEYRDGYPKVIYMWKGIVGYEKQQLKKPKAKNEKKDSEVV